MLACASAIICNTPTQFNALRRRCPWVTQKSQVILNGIDSDLMRQAAPIRAAGPGVFVIMHCGQFYGRRSPTVWFEALRRLKERQPDLARRVRLALLGPPTCDGKPLRDLAASAGVADMVDVLGSRSHGEALSLMAGADALALAGADGDGAELQVPNKLFEYLGVRRPILAAVSLQSPAVNLLRDTHADAHICAPGDADAICEAMVRLASRDVGGAPVVEMNLESIDRSRRAAELLGVFERLVRFPFLASPFIGGVALDAGTGRRGSG